MTGQLSHARPATPQLNTSLRTSYTHEGRTDLRFRAQVFFEQPAISAGVVMLPAHQMHSRIDARGYRSLQWKLQYRDAHTPLVFSPPDKPPPVRRKPTYGVSGR